MIDTLVATLACRLWEGIAYRSRQRRPHTPWTSDQLAEYLDATERYSKQAGYDLAA